MPINAAFYGALKQPVVVSGAMRPALYQALSQQQVDSLNALVSVFDAFTGHDHCIDDLAYIMATCYRECGPTLNLSISEIGKGAGKAYGVPINGRVYYGRGPCQVTWLANYQKAKLATLIDFVNYPEYMCDPAKGVVYMIAAMYAGTFTGKALRTYITPGKVTTLAAFTECRRIINGVDHAQEVAYVALAFQAALRLGYTAPVTALPTVASQQPQSRGLWAGILRMFGGK